METTLQAEEQLVAELEQLGVRYLSRQSNVRVANVRPPQELLAELVHQPSSRVRAALIALFLLHPDYAEFVLGVLDQLAPPDACSLKFFYSAAVCLQQQYAEKLRIYVGVDWRWLPDLFAEELGLKGDTPFARLRVLAELHAQWVGVHLNWAGTYDNAARHLLRRLELERTWNQ